MRRDDFNEQAMEEKIRKNEAIGFTKKQILLKLKEEKRQCLQVMSNAEKRIMELNDQIDYITEKYPEFK